MIPKYVIDLTTQERERLEEIVGTLEESAATITHAQILLASDIHVSPKLSVREISERFGTNHQTVYRIRSDYVELGLERAIYRKARTVKPETKKLNPKVIEQIKELALSTPPEGKKTWSIRSLCKTCTEKGIVNHIANASMLTILRQLNITLATEKEN